MSLVWFPLAFLLLWVMIGVDSALARKEGPPMTLQRVRRVKKAPR